MGEPFFPPPKPAGDGAGYREPAKVADDAAPTPTRAPAVVTRPDPIVEEPAAAPGGKKPMPKLSPEEVRALLATEGASSSALARCGKRAVILVPVGLIRWGFAVVLGGYGEVAMMIVTIALFAGAFAWMAAPLWKQSKDGWV